MLHLVSIRSAIGTDMNAAGAMLRKSRTPLLPSFISCSSLGSSRLCLASALATSSIPKPSLMSTCPPPSSSSMVTLSTAAKPVTDYSVYFSPRAAARKPSAIRALQTLTSVPGMISLGGGNPHPSTFPFASIQYTLKNGEVIDIPASQVAQGLQYSATPGIDKFVAWLSDFQVYEHKRNAAEFGVCIGNGSQDLLTKAIDAFVTDGGTMMMESPAYVGMNAYIRPMGVNIVEVPIDAEGLNPESMETTLANWPDIKTRPRILYTVPTAGNPTGITTTLARKKRIYEVARKYDVIILEDDPYYFLQFSDTRDPSYFSFDVDGRVLRFDSLSKVLSGGARIGWVSGPKPLVERIVLHGMGSNLHPSGISQIMMYSLLEKWGIQGFLAHNRDVAAFYKEKCAAFIESARRHLDGIAEFVPPTAGMFVWLKLIGIDDSTDLIKRKAVDKKVLLVPGIEFLPNQRPTPYVRASYSLATKEEIDTALSRLRELVLDARNEKSL
ncbi:hypothetical protein BASA50_004487 [Batrachochytrium salamandrivorans]|uniref:Aminotransferase class I/classII large domain-containing protein n=1 Tax=Batrachochytrium salamandrivorans TaxID=1357716 RepID=A0ABQ8FFD0_9FUNG|nr:hypothetical protein BASA50_004487 [Batrachochytrium salamandrivorans]KAH9266188.1 hypothetical protein BASA84_001232 [Batrachochytrium salamandrivorans]KAH9276212.1 hypothetical protein BASA83_001486 [Batrachochytrium salamandrivorans]KAJ1330532.1 hypothetical protein BSLG_009294 [Batrachochytrium salamandrivorans]